jgi:hypothetical protein
MRFSFLKFVDKNHIQLQPRVDKACMAGIRLMTKSPDPLHNHKHVYRILNDLDLMIHQSHDINWKKVDFNVLLLSICWHDIWKGRRFPKSKKRLLYHWFAEGIGSMRIFSREVKKYNLDKKVVKKVKYSIRKHSSFQITPRRTLESKILKSLDEMEDFSTARLQDALDSIHTLSEFGPRLFSLFNLYINHWVRRKKGYGNKNSWSRKEYQKRKAVFYEHIWPIVKNYLQSLSSSTPQSHLSLPTETQTTYPENAG